MKTNIKSKLTKLRKKINQIDKQIIALLNKRSYIIPKVKKIKEKHINYKVAFDREYKMAKKLDKSNFGLYSNIFMQKIWRELISATLKIECNLTIGILKDANNYRDMWELTKDHFGVYTNLILIEDTKNLLDMLIDKKIDVAILPSFNSTANKWWAWLGMAQYKNIKINLELPLFKDFKTLNANKALCLSLNNDDRAEVLFYLASNPTAELLNNKDIQILDNTNLDNNILYLISTQINLTLGNKDALYIGSTPINIR
jgi:chorismate mutase